MQAGAVGSTPRNRSMSANAQTVLVVEDDAAVRELVARLMQRAGYAVLKARHSDEALYFSVEFTGSIHLLITDLCMAPHFNGRRLAEMIRRDRPDIRVLYISGFVDDDAVVTEIELGLAHFLPKPFTPEILLESVRLAMAEPAMRIGNSVQES